MQSVTLNRNIMLLHYKLLLMTLKHSKTRHGAEVSATTEGDKNRRHLGVYFPIISVVFKTGQVVPQDFKHSGVKAAIPQQDKSYLGRATSVPPLQMLILAT